jgi:hypothetical protein
MSLGVVEINQSLRKRKIQFCAIDRWRKGGNFVKKNYVNKLTVHIWIQLEINDVSFCYLLPFKSIVRFTAPNLLQLFACITCLSSIS